MNNQSKRWHLRFIENGKERTVIAYGTDMQILALTTKLNAHADPAGKWDRNTNMPICDDLCNFSDPNQYLPWQSHNQPHKGK